LADLGFIRSDNAEGVTTTKCARGFALSQPRTKEADPNKSLPRSGAPGPSRVSENVPKEVKSLSSQQRRNAMRRSGIGSGGGLGSKNVVNPPVKTGSGSASTRPAGVAQIGNSWGNHTTNKGESNYSGERLHNPERNFQPTKFGNEIAANTTCGPGGSRTIYKTGSQDQYGTNPGDPRPNPRHDALENE
jgi:hypothetical protein